MGDKLAIFLDTNFFIALYSKRDKFKPIANDLFQKLRNAEFGTIYTSDYVLDELITIIQRKNYYEKAKELANLWFVESKGFAKILYVSDQVLINTVKIYSEQSCDRKKINFTDCTNVALCKDNGIIDIISFEKEFNKYLNCIPRLD